MLSSIREYVKPKPISRQNQKLTQQHNRLKKLGRGSMLGGFAKSTLTES